MIDEKILIEKIENDYVAFKSELYTDDSVREYFIGMIEDQPKIEKCGDCSRRKFYQMGYEAANNKWIPISNKPTEEEKVIISTKDDVVTSGLYTKRYGFDMREGFICDSGFIDLNEVLAWQPFPKAYRQEEK